VIAGLVGRADKARASALELDGKLERCMRNETEQAPRDDARRTERGDAWRRASDVTRLLHSRSIVPIVPVASHIVVVVFGARFSISSMVGPTRIATSPSFGARHVRRDLERDLGGLPAPDARNEERQRPAHAPRLRVSLTAMKQYTFWRKR